MSQSTCQFANLRRAIRRSLLARRLFVLATLSLVGLLLAVPGVAQVDDDVATVFYPDESCCGKVPWSNVNYGQALAAGDFDGDGHAELAIGVPGANRGAASEAGAVVVQRGGSDGPNGGPTLIVQEDFSGGLSESMDRFGAQLAAGHFDADSCADLAIGVPFDNPDGEVEAGIVYVLYGSCLPGGTLFREERTVYRLANVLGAGFQQPGDRFGSGLAVGDFDADGLDDLAIGATGEGIGGRVVVLYAHPDGRGLSTLGEQLIHRGLVGFFVGLEQADENFGRHLAAGDFDGDGADDLVISAIARDIDGVVNVGQVVVVYGSQVEDGLDLSTGETWSQGGGLVGAPELNTYLGAALAVGDFDGDGADDLAIGSPYEDVPNGGPSQLLYAGAINLLPGQVGSGLAGPGTILVQSDLSPQESEAEELFAWALTAGDLWGDGADDLIIGTVAEDIDVLTPGGWVELTAVGTTHIVPGLRDQGLDPSSTRHWIGTPQGLAAGDQWGGAFAVGPLGHGGADDLAVASVGHRHQGELDAGMVTVLYSTALFQDGFESGDTSAWD
jgi:hypothetical protein